MKKVLIFSVFAFFAFAVSAQTDANSAAKTTTSEVAQTKDAGSSAKSVALGGNAANADSKSTCSKGDNAKGKDGASCCSSKSSADKAEKKDGKSPLHAALRSLQQRTTRTGNHLAAQEVS